MASWTPIDDLRIQPGQTLASSDDWEALLDNIAFLRSPPAVFVWLTADRTVQDSTDHTVSWDAAPWDTHGFWTSGSSIVVPVAGVYDVQAISAWQAGPGNEGGRAMWVYRNAMRRRDVQMPGGWAGSRQAALPIATPLDCAEGDSVTLQVRQASGGPLNLRPERTFMSMIWRRPRP